MKLRKREKADVVEIYSPGGTKAVGISGYFLMRISAGLAESTGIGTVWACPDPRIDDDKTRILLTPRVYLTVRLPPMVTVFKIAVQASSSLSRHILSQIGRFSRRVSS